MSTLNFSPSVARVELPARWPWACTCTMQEGWLDSLDDNETFRVPDPNCPIHREESGR